MRKRRVKRMNATVQKKPIRPTEANFANRVAEQQFFDYIKKTTKSNSVGMNKIREMMKNHKEEKR